MFMRQLMLAAFLSAVLACAGCHCGCKRPCAYAPPCPCGPAGPAVAVPAAPAPVTANCPTCVGP